MSKYRAWCFTIVINYEDKAWDIPEVLPPRAKYLICQHEEGKENGTEHIQGYIYFDYQVKLKTVKKRLKCTWAHLEPAKGTAEENKIYCSKEDTRVAGPWELGEMPVQGKRSDLEENKKAFSKAIEADTRDEAEHILKVHQPRVFITNYNNVQSFLNSKIQPANYESPYPRDSFRETEKMKEWADQIGKGLLRCKVLLLISDPEFGKTQWARSLGPHVYLDAWKLDEFREVPNYQYIVFDDCEPSLRPQRNMMLGMNETVVTDKYSKKLKLKCQGKPVIWLCNPERRPEWSGEPAYFTQTIEETLSEKLF